MDLVNMKRIPSPKEGGNVLASCCGPEEPYYPISLHLSAEEINKLGLSGSTLGQEKMFHAVVRVTSISKGEREGGDSYEDMTLTVISAAVDKPKMSPEDKLYGGA